MSVWVKEFDDSGELPMHRAIQKLRDEVTGVAMRNYGGRNRELSLVMAKLDEAHQWAVSHGVATGKLAIVDRQEILKVAADV